MPRPFAGRRNTRSGRGLFVFVIADAGGGRGAGAIDKLMYFACSGKLYLAGLAPAKAVAAAAKARLLTHLRQRGSQVTRPSAPSETLSLGDLSLLTPDFQKE